MKLSKVGTQTAVKICTSLIYVLTWIYKLDIISFAVKSKVVPLQWLYIWHLFWVLDAYIQASESVIFLFGELRWASKTLVDLVFSVKLSSPLSLCGLCYKGCLKNEIWDLLIEAMIIYQILFRIWIEITLGFIWNQVLLISIPIMWIRLIQKKEKEGF